MTDVLVILLNYRRPENLTMLIESLRRQTVRPRIAIWNNGAEREFAGVDLVVDASDNLKCLPRWHVAAMLGRQYVAVIDDDLMPIRDDLLEQCVRTCRKYGDERILGWTGVKFGPAPRYYRNARHRESAKDGTDTFADVVKGGFMFLHVDLLREVPLRCTHYDDRGDDLWICLSTAKRSRFHVIPGFMAGAIRELDEGDVALWREPGHFEKRDRLIQDMIDSGEVRWISKRRGAALERRFRHWRRRAPGQQATET